MAQADFWDGIAERYAARPLSKPEFWEATLERCRHWLEPQMRAVELGCGTGSTALRLADCVASYTGTDVSGEMIRIAAAKQAPEGLSFLQADASAALDGGADVVLAFNLLHLIPDLPGLLRAVFAALPEGGLLISKTPCLGHKRWLRPLIAGLRWIGKAPPDIGFFRTDALEALIRDAGFEILETGDYPASLPSHFVVARKG
ncbi:class I SAM-dependent methyltransferase [Pacificoceanicola onchidii]|uniref:class I SAM-dependent methyltransferase n=1 Tax=Pacificoceanicola onchidii TaxID=2562685 RepID=UPI0010A59970|nr:class I SAM-dependent methyltransferase [Pacificoceanicola onchidii]